jgi:hypothetical protein
MSASLALAVTPVAELPRRASEDEFFDAGDEGTYDGGPRSSIPTLFVEPDPEEVAARLLYRSNAAHKARMRRGLRIVGAVLLLASAPLLVALWRYVSSANLSQAEASSADSSKAAAGSVEAGLEAPDQPSALGAVAASGVGEPAGPGAEQAAVSPRIAPVNDEPAPEDPSAAAEVAAEEPALTQPASSPPRPARAGAAAARAKPALAAELAPVSPSPLNKASSTAAGLVPRRSSSDKPPTAAYPLLRAE